MVSQFSSVTQSCPTLCNPMDCSTPGVPVHHQLPELTQAHVHWVGDAIQPPLLLFSSHLQSFPISGSFPMSQFFASGGQSGTKTVCHRDSPFFLRTVQALIKAMGKTLNQLSCVSWVSLHRYLLIMSLAFSIFPEDWGLKEQCKWYSIPRTFDTPGVIVDLKMEHRCSEL